MTQQADLPEHGESSGAGSGLTRRSVLTTTGLAVAGVGLAGGAEADAAPRDSVAAARHGTVVEFQARIAQQGGSGELFVSYGFLTKVSGAPRAALFTGSGRTVSTALLTAYATGKLTARFADQAVHSLDIVGTMSVYQRAHGGADFSDPDSFRVGRLVARFDMTMQDVLTVFAPGAGLPTLTGDMRQTQARALRGHLAGKKFGRRDQRLRFFASGLGMLTDPAKPNAQLEVAGNWSAE
jgi:hypothetical protein